MRIEKCFGVGNWACVEDVYQLFASYLKEWGIQGERSSFIPVVKFTYSCLDIVMLHVFEEYSCDRMSLCGCKPYTHLDEEVI